ncbi:MAG: hypothetical protein LOX97_08360 [Sphingomonas sp.]|nr:hypothetical protein [Sphingomonas sp.]
MTLVQTIEVAAAVFLIGAGIWLQVRSRKLDARHGSQGAVILMALAGMPLHDKLVNSWFMAVTPRTAGFNGIDYGTAGNDTLALTMILMVIGAILAVHGLGLLEYRPMESGL